jgi:transcriptional regulator with XRE-family HTH domain
MDNRAQVREFLASRRARITPDQAGLPAYGGNRRVKGLRREEVALLAGVSIDYYIRMERGDVAGASEAVLDSVANALQLDEAEREHLQALARSAGPSEPDLRLNLYTADPDTPAADGLKLLASWAATRAVDNTDTRHAHGIR